MTSVSVSALIGAVTHTCGLVTITLTGQEVNYNWASDVITDAASNI